MTDKLEALKAKKPTDTKTLAAEKAGYVTDDNSGGYYVVECQECGEIYPSQESGGGGQIADTGDYDDSYCPHCGYVDPDECDNVGLVWNVQQAKINALLAALEEANSKNYLADMLEWRKKAQAAEKELGQWRDVATAAAQDDADWRKLVNIKNHAICQLANAVIAQINKTEASGRREEHLKATVDVLSAKNAELERTNAAQDDHINQQQDRIDTLEKRNGELGKHVGKLEKLLKGTEESLIASVDMVSELEQRLQQPMPKGFLHQDGAIHALLGSNDVMISHVKRGDAHGIAFSPVPAGKKEIGINFDSDIAGKGIDEIGAVFTVESTSVQSLELLKEAVQMAIDGFKVEGE